jgi:hypothetical protein
MTSFELLALCRFCNGFHNRFTHFAGADLLCAFRPDVDRAQTRSQDGLHSRLNAVGRFGLVQ